ncbi:hypothetical protein PNP59_00025 [Halobacterium salinarum]|uniref:homing endonuclease associated repeat-containing protein n=1 Tax=Halobacterium salinarum TaxID=2242 RepID=UPI0025530B0D|nr:hypothetical protein [Halobacterium salinarum]MDL0129318.1 hypothetical protein [Halobacterium salinarum]
MYSREDLLSEVHRLADEDNPPTTTKLREEGQISEDPFRRVFGSWHAALRAAGYEPDQEYNISRKDLLAEIHRLASKDSPPKVTKINTEGKYSEQPYYDEFESYNAAVREAGYKPDRVRNIDEEILLEELSAQAKGEVAPSEDCYTGKYSTITYKRCFGSWWRSCVRAGLKPQSRRPLTPVEFRNFFESSINQNHPKDQLIGLLVQFTGLPPSIIASLSESWLVDRNNDTLVIVPENITKSGSRWVVRLPETWNDSGTQRETRLSSLLKWYFEIHSSIVESKSACNNTIYRIASSAGLSDRERVHIERIGNVPRVHPEDLRATGGVKMALNGAPAQRIRRHLGIEHTGWNATVKDFFIWCDIHDDSFSHPDYNRPDNLRNSG